MRGKQETDKNNAHTTSHIGAKWDYIQYHLYSLVPLCIYVRKVHSDMACFGDVGLKLFREAIVSLAKGLRL